MPSLGNLRRGNPAWVKGRSANPGGRPRGFEDVAQRARDLGPLAIERLGEILRDPKSKDGAVIRAAELLLERGYGKAPAFHTNDPGEFRDVLEMTDAEIRDRLAVLRGLLLEHGIDPVGAARPERQRKPSVKRRRVVTHTPGWLRRASCAPMARRGNPLGSKAEARTQAADRVASKTSPNAPAILVRSPSSGLVRSCVIRSQKTGR